MRLAAASCIPFLILAGCSDKPTEPPSSASGVSRGDPTVTVHTIWRSAGSGSAYLILFTNGDVYSFTGGTSLGSPVADLSPPIPVEDIRTWSETIILETDGTVWQLVDELWYDAGLVPTVSGIANVVAAEVVDENNPESFYGTEPALRLLMQSGVVWSWVQDDDSHPQEGRGEYHWVFDPYSPPVPGTDVELWSGTYAVTESRELYWRSGRAHTLPTDLERALPVVPVFFGSFDTSIAGGDRRIALAENGKVWSLDNGSVSRQLAGQLDPPTPTENINAWSYRFYTTDTGDIYYYLDGVTEWVLIPSPY